MQVILLTHTMKKKHNMGICNYKAQNTSFRRKKYDSHFWRCSGHSCNLFLWPKPLEIQNKGNHSRLEYLLNSVLHCFISHTGQKSSLGSRSKSTQGDRPVAVLTHEWWDGITRLSLACSRPCKDSLLLDCSSEVRVSMEKFWFSLIPPKLSSGSACNQREILVLKSEMFPLKGAGSKLRTA